MTTKDSFFPTWKNASSTSDSTSYNGQYNNLNLNQNYQFSKLDNFQSATNYSIKSNQNTASLKVTDDFDFKQSKTKDVCFDKSDKSSKQLNVSDLYHSKTDNSYQLKKDKKSASKNGSTLSLHIVAYENSAEAFSTANDEKSDTNLNQLKKNEKHTITGLKLLNSNPFEFPRQENEGIKVPEVSKFKASQRILNPNKASKNGRSNKMPAQKKLLSNKTIDASSKKEPKAENLFIAAKVRPYSAEIESSLDIDSENSKITVISRNKGFHFNNVFDENATQEAVYDTVAQPIVDYFLDGINGTIFAYGQTGSGKTYTMNGNKISETSDSQNRGIIPRSIESIFEYLKARLKIDAQFEFLLKCSYIEVYKKVAFDLLQTDRAKVKIQASGEQIIIDGAKEFVVESVEECLLHLQKGWQNRQTAETLMNPESSRSHAIFMLTLVTDETKGTYVNRRTSCLNFVDLAGSESQTENTGDRLKEGACINQDLSHLANVIRIIAEKGAFIPYRNCSLTLLLRDSLGGNSKTAVIVTVHPNLEFVGDTVSTLNFAESCKKVKNQAKVNEAVSTKDVEAWKAEKQKAQDENLILKEEKENLSKENQQLKEEKEHMEKRKKDDANIILILQNEKETLKAKVEDATQTLHLMEFEKLEKLNALKDEQKLKDEMSARILEYEALLEKTVAEQKVQINALEKSQKKASELQLAQMKKKHNLEIKKIMDDLKNEKDALQKIEDELNEYKLLVAEKDKIIDISKNEMNAKILEYVTLLEKASAEHKEHEKIQKETYELQLAQTKKENLKMKELSKDLKKANEKVEDKKSVAQMDFDADLNASFGDGDYTNPATEGNQTIDLTEEKSPVEEHNPTRTSSISHADGEVKDTESNEPTPSTDENDGNNETDLNAGTENNQPSLREFSPEEYEIHSNNTYTTNKKELIIFLSRERKECYRYYLRIGGKFCCYNNQKCWKTASIVDKNGQKYVRAELPHSQNCQPLLYFESIPKDGFKLSSDEKHLWVFVKRNGDYDQKQCYKFNFSSSKQRYKCGKCDEHARVWTDECDNKYVRMCYAHKPDCHPKTV